MRRSKGFVSTVQRLFAISWLGLVGFSSMSQGAQPIVVHLTADGPIAPPMAEYLDRGLTAAKRQGAEAVILELNTPGGSIDSMNRMVESIRGSTIPVIVYVAPRGAMAASAGTIVTLAGHAAAMAPETAIGAASPVGSGGQNLTSTEETKIKEMLKATARSLATRRGTQAMNLVNSAIDQATAASAQEAQAAGLVDVIATDVPDLLAKLDGYQVETADGPQVLHLANARVVEMPPSFIETMLKFLTDPNIVFILLAVGVQALLIEIASPGGWIAGFVGVVCLALAGYGIGILPVNWFGLIFILTAFVLFLLDIKAPTHGALTLAGLVSLVVGALVLFNSPGTPGFERVSIPLVVGTSLLTSAAFFTVVSFAVRAQLRPMAVGREALVGRVGRAQTALNPAGMVQVAGELWSAELEEGQPRLKAGAQVEVISVHGLKLQVRPKSPPAS